MSAYSTGREEGERVTQLRTLASLTRVPNSEDIVREVVCGWAHDIIWDYLLRDGRGGLFGITDLLRAAYDCGPPVDAENLWEMAR